jgi:hypothetical protein
MAGGKAYCIKARELRAMAAREKDPAVRAELRHLALAYLRLAEQADRNSRLDLTYETPPPKDRERRAR